MSATLTAAFPAVRPDLRHILEFGVASGGTIRGIRKHFDPRYDVYGFDTFTGLPFGWGGTKLGVGAFERNGVAPDVDGVQFFKGRFCFTIPEYLKVAQPIGLLHVDCDLYISTIEVLYSLNDYIVEGTVIVFDEWIYNHNPLCVDGERKACFEWMHFLHRKIRYLPTPGWDVPETEQRAVVVVK